MVICAAIKYRHNDQEIMVPGHRHGDVFSLMHDLNCNRKDYVELEQGFMLSDGSFADRKDSFDHALKCGQLSATVRQYKREHNEIELYSEDLY